MEVNSQPSTSALLKAVESLKKSGLSGIGNVIQTTSPEYLDAASFSQDSYLVQTMASDKENKESLLKVTKSPKSPKNNSEHDMNSLSLHIFPESVSHLGSVDGTRSIDMDMATISIASADIETVGTTSTVESVAQTPSPPLSITALMTADPTADSRFSIEASTKHCSRGKNLWEAGKCEEAILEFRKALLGLESLLGNNHLLVSKLYYWMGQVFLQLLDDKNNTNDTAERRRALADAAVESLTWSLKIRYTQPSDDDDNNNSDVNFSGDEETEAIEDSLEQAWKVQAQCLPLSNTSRTKPSKNIEMLEDSITLERKADLALFRMEKNQLSQAIDVYVSLVNRYNKSIEACSDDGAFSAMVKMAFWYHKLGRLRAIMDRKTDSDVESDSSRKSVNSMPIDTTNHSKANAKKNHTKSISRTYLEHAAFWYRMALEGFCTGIGRFDKESEEPNPGDSIEITTHPTYQQLLLRIKQVLSDHHKSDKHSVNQKTDKEQSYLKSSGVSESILYHFSAKEVIKNHGRFDIKMVDSLPQLKVLQEELVKAKEGLSASIDIEKSIWGSDHQIVVRMSQELTRASRLKDTMELEISSFPAKQALRKKIQQEEKQRKLDQERQRQQEQQKRKKKSPSGHSGKGSEYYRRSEKLPEKRQSKLDELLEVGSIPSKDLPRQQPRHQKPKISKHQRSKSPSGPVARKEFSPTNAIETLRRLQDEVAEYKKRLEEQNTGGDEFRSQLQSKTDEVLQSMATIARKEEEVTQWKQNCEEFQNEKESLQRRIKVLEKQVSLGRQKQGQLEFTMKKEGVDLVQSATQKEVELEYWRRKFEAAQSEWTESQTSLEEELRKARTNAGSREADLIEWKGKFEGVDGEWKTCQEQIKRLQQENVRLQNEVASGLAERKQLEFSKQMNDLEFVQTKEQQVLEAMTKATKSESEAASWKRKYEVAQKEWLAIHNRGDEKTRDAIADATIKTSELSRWKKKFEIAQREWMECQTRVERQARGAIATAKQYEVSHAELLEKFTAAQNGLKKLSDQNKDLQKQLVDSESKQDQLEFTLKKQAIDFANVHETLNRKAAEAQIWKEQCQASQQAQKQISHEIQFARAADGSLQDRIADLRQQIDYLKERNRELQADQECNKLELEAKNKEVAVVKEAALKRIRQLKKERKQEKSSSSSRSETKDTTVESMFTEDLDPSEQNSLVAKLGRTQRALEYVETEHKESMEEIESLKLAKKRMEESIVEAQKIIALLKIANNERIKQCSKLEKERDQARQKLEETIAETGAIAAPVESSGSRSGVSLSEKDEQRLTAHISSLEAELRKAELRNEKLLTDLDNQRSDSSLSYSEKNDQQFSARISKLESQLQKSELRNEELQSELKKQKLQNFAPSRNWSRQPDAEKPEEDERVKVLSDRCEELERELCVSNHQVEDLKDTLSEYSESSHHSTSFGDTILPHDVERVLKEPNENTDNDITKTSEKDRIKALLKHCEALERDILIANHQITDLEDELEQYKERGEPTGSNNEYHDMILAQDLERELEQSNQIRKNLSSELEVYEGKVVRAEEKEKEFKKKLDVSNEQIKSLRTSVRDLTKLNLSQHGGGKKDERSLAIIEDLEEELEDSNEIREKLAVELKLCKEKIEHAERKEKEFQWLSKEYSELEEKLEESNQIREEMASTLSSLKKRLSRSEEKENGTDALEKKLSKLEQKLEESSNRNERLQSQIDNLSSSSGSDDEQRRRLVDKIHKLEKELGDCAQEINSLKKERDKVTEDLEDLEEENEELTKKYERLQKQYRGTKKAAEQSTRNLSAMLESETKEQERVRQKYAKLEKDLEETSQRNEELESIVDGMKKKNIGSQGLEEDLREMSKRNKELESRVDEMRKRNIQNLKLEKDFEKISERNKELESRMDRYRKRNLERIGDNSIDSCQQCLVLGEELRSTIEQNEKHVLTTEKFQDEHDQLLDRYSFLEKELKEAMEQNEALESQLIAKDNNPRDGSLDNDDKYQELNIRCIELEEQLRDSSDLNNKKQAQLDALRTKIADLEAYADDTAADLEQAESIIGALKAEGAGEGAEVTLLMGRCNKLQEQLKEALRVKERITHDLDNSQKENIKMKEELNENLDNLVVNINVEDTKAENATGKAVEELNEKLDALTTAKEELEISLKKAIEENEQQKRLKGHVEKDRDYLDKMYNECKSEMAKVQTDLDATKEHLKKSNDEKEELERKLQIEKHVSSSLKTSQKNQDADESEENELEELYRQARDELSEVESMLFETEEELEALKAKYEKLQEESKNPSIKEAESEEINHDLHDLSRDELMKETKKALRKMQETQFKVVDLQETNMILQAQLKSSLTFKEKSRQPVRGRNNGNRGGFWSLGGGDGENKTNDGDAKKGEESEGPRPLFSRFGRGRGGDANNQKNEEDTADK